MLLPALVDGALAATGVELVNQISTTLKRMAAADASCPSVSRAGRAKPIPTFLQVDFGLVRDAGGAIQPKLVELQAFASLYGFQLAVAEAYRDAFELPRRCDLYLDGPRARRPITRSSARRSSAATIRPKSC